MVVGVAVIEAGDPGFCAAVFVAGVAGMVAGITVGVSGTVAGVAVVVVCVAVGVARCSRDGSL